MHTRRRSLAALALGLAVALGASACSGAQAELPTATATQLDASTAPGVRVAPPEEAHALVDSEDVVVLDVRTPEEYAAGHIDGAVLVDFQADDFAERIDALDRDTTYVLYCRSGNRSAQARALMADLGFRDVTDVAGGFQAWQAAGLPATS